MEIDHVFMFVDGGGAEPSRLAALGLTETYRRRHPGQGTQNVCYAFDNLYLELLWVNDEAELRSPAIARTRLYERSLWRGTDACPFGIAWRGGGSPQFDTWDYRPPYLPQGVVIAVAIDGDDPRQPMVFRSPGASTPSAWPAERRGLLQRPGGFGAVTAIELRLPAGTQPSPALLSIARSAAPSLSIATATRPGLRLSAARLDGGETAMELPFPD